RGARRDARHRGNRRRPRIADRHARRTGRGDGSAHHAVVQEAGTLMREASARHIVTIGGGRAAALWMVRAVFVGGTDLAFTDTVPDRRRIGAMGIESGDGRIVEAGVRLRSLTEQVAGAARALRVGAARRAGVAAAD